MAKLDHCTPKLMDVVSSRGGATGMRIRQIKDMLFQVWQRVAIRCLDVYLGEKQDDLFKEFSDTEEFEAGLDRQVMKIGIIGTPGSEHRMATIMVGGTKIVEGKDIPRCCALLMGIIYALNLSYPKELKFTFEVFQKLFLDLDGLKASARVMSLKNGIF
ncbi:uncharacterized protein LOC143005735 [Genypterus blacodes]|uniref:uncharacterized protein LOC143005735 n=1 Tax=Genypterus blacodes TaxID=154954 RepID=UPI003F75D305